MSNTPTDQTDLIILQSLEAFTEGYIPATADNVDDYLSTDAIALAIYSHTGIKTEHSEVYNFLYDKGFRFKARNGGLEWMVKKVA